MAVTIKAGQTFAQIAKENNVSTKELLKANPQITRRRGDNKYYASDYVGCSVAMPHKISSERRQSSFNRYQFHPTFPNPVPNFFDNRPDAPNNRRAQAIAELNNVGKEKIGVRTPITVTQDKVKIKTFGTVTSYKIKEVAGISSLVLNVKIEAGTLGDVVVRMPNGVLCFGPTFERTSDRQQVIKKDVFFDRLVNVDGSLDEDYAFDI